MRELTSGIRYLLFALCAAFCIAFLAPQTRLDSRAATPPVGIDVSGFQGTISWPLVKQSGIQFAMVRCGNMVYGLDSMFAYNMTMANASGIRTGVYCYTYALNAAQAMLDAQLVVNACANYTVSFPIAVDFEDESQLGLTPQQQADIVNAFCAVIYNAGYTPMVYSSRNWFVTRMGPVTWDHWVAQYNDSCDYPGAYTMWQYTSHGAVAGINGRVDMDYLFRDYFTLIKASGFDTRNGKTYYYNNYKRAVGLQTIAGKAYFFDATGAMTTGWFGTAPAEFYFDPADGGAAAVGWRTIQGKKYYFNANALVTVGIATIDGANYMFDATGAMVTGFVTANGVTQYFDPATGKQLFGWQSLGGKKYYFNANGAAAVGLTPIGGLNYYFNADGSQATGLVTAPDGSVYDFGNADGSMAIGWQQINGGWFFFGADGKVVTNMVFVDAAGVQVQVNGQGLLVAPAGYTPPAN